MPRARNLTHFTAISILAATATTMLIACASAPPPPKGPGPEYEEPPTLPAASDAAAPADAIP